MRSASATPNSAICGWSKTEASWWPRGTATPLHTATKSSLASVVHPGHVGAGCRAANTRCACTYRDCANIPISAGNRSPWPVSISAAFARCRVPMLKDQEVVGAIRDLPPGSTPVHRQAYRIVQNFASQAVIAIENTRLLNELRQSATSSRLPLPTCSRLSAVRRAIWSQFFRLCLRTPRASARPSSARCFSRDGDLFRVVAAHGAPAAYREAVACGDPFSSPDTGLGMLLKTKRSSRSTISPRARPT